MRITDKVLAEKIEEVKDCFGDTIITYTGSQLKSLRVVSWTGYNALCVESAPSESGISELATGSNKELYIFLKGLLAFAYAQKRFN
jgi:hypothetical protein